MGQALAAGPPRIGRGGEGGQDLLVEEMRERAVPDVVQQPGHPQGLHDQALGRDGFGGTDQLAAQAGVQRPCPHAGLVHDARGRG